ncbi:hypothetical protein F4804DRAFT_32516 [Jackrogersella minutella]|nr:hypothetical protein F4804DRAFT_32516 [Jackrogersella minutella]
MNPENEASRHTLATEEGQRSQSSLRSLPFGDFGTEGLHQCAIGLSTLLEEFATEVSRPQTEIIDLLGQLKILLGVSHELNNGAFDQNQGQTSDPTQDQLWQSVNIISQRCCNDTIGPLHDNLENIKTHHNPDPALYQLLLPQEDLQFYQNVLQALRYQTAVFSVLQKAIYLGILKMNFDSEDNAKIAYDVASTISHLASRLTSELKQAPQFYSTRHEEGLNDMLAALEGALSVTRLVPAKSINKHWRIPRSANRIFTGRRKELEAIAEAFSMSSSSQRRFVVQGMPGSGKSDLVLKYAEEHGIYYWGIFWVDASTRENAKASYAEIGKLGGVEPIEQAAKHWLSHLHASYTWLLIIDNADAGEVTLEELFPPSVPGFAQGCILVTTRSPENRDYGTTGSLQLGEMNDVEANELLLLAADVEKPWKSNPIELAKTICKHLHYLPLALQHAGRAIKDGLCELANYIKFFDTQASRIRSLRYIRRDRSLSRSKRRSSEDEEHMSIFGSYEILYESLEGAATRDDNGIFQDALQLLQIFSYMHFQNIRLDVIVHAAVCPILEEDTRNQNKREEKEILERIGYTRQPSWTAWLQNLVFSIRGHRLFFSPPILPEVLKNTDGLDVPNLQELVKIRLQTALKVLVDRGLINRGEGRDATKSDRRRYHMHPIVHQWVRERPQLSVAEGALYCQVATTVLARAVRLVGKDEEGETAMRRDMKPHIDQVLHYAGVNRKHFQENQRRKRMYFWSMRFGIDEPLKMNPARAGEYGRFSRVYMECGAYREAERLLLHVHGYVIARLGHDHELTHVVKEALAGVLWLQTRWNDASKLFREVYESRKKTLGPMHPLTIEITNRLGGAVLSQGRITEALQLHEDAKANLTEIYGPKHKETLLTIGLIGRCYFYRMDWERSIELHKMASKALRKLWEEDPIDESTELEVLSSEEDFAMGLIRVPKDNYDDALEVMHRVMEQRVKILGKEAPWTLVARGNYGRILSKCGRFAEADKLMRETLEVAERNHGKDHLAVIAGRCWYGQVLSENGELEKAENQLRQAVVKDVYKKAAADDGEHPDRILAVWILAQCLTKQGRVDEALELYEELNANIPLIGGKGLGQKHKMARMLPKIIEDLQKQKLSS